MKVWKFTPGDKGMYWDYCRENNEIAMGWGDVGHLSWFSSMDELREKCDKVNYPTGTPRTSEAQLWDFKNIMEGDVIVSYALKTILGIGIVTGHYYYEGSKEKAIGIENQRKFAHRYSTHWVLTPDYDISKDIKLLETEKGKLTYSGTIHELTDNYTLDKIKKMLIDQLFK